MDDKSCAEFDPEKMAKVMKTCQEAFLKEFPECADKCKEMMASCPCDCCDPEKGCDIKQA